MPALSRTLPLSALLILLLVSFSQHSRATDLWTLSLDCFVSMHKKNNGSKNPLKISIVQANGNVLNSRELIIPSDECSKLEVGTAMDRWLDDKSLRYSEESHEAPEAGFSANPSSGRNQIIRFEATGDDAILIDGVKLKQYCGMNLPGSSKKEDPNCGKYDRQWGENGGNAWCLSTDPNDNFGERQRTACLRCLEFTPDGLTHSCNNTQRAHAKKVLKGVANKRCVAMASGKSQKPIAAHCNMNTQVDLKPIKKDYLQIKYTNFGKCLFHSKKNTFGFYKCNKDYNDQWWKKINMKADGSFQLKNAASGKCLFSDSGAKLGTYSCNKKYSDQFFTVN
ncbi:MAG: RICIN domain-containing protein [Cellvibrionaceae bacterium]